METQQSEQLYMALIEQGMPPEMARQVAASASFQAEQDAYSNFANVAQIGGNSDFGQGLTGALRAYGLVGGLRNAKRAGETMGDYGAWKAGQGASVDPSTQAAQSGAPGAMPPLQGPVPGAQTMPYQGGGPPQMMPIQPGGGPGGMPSDMTMQGGMLSPEQEIEERALQEALRRYAANRGR